MATMHQSKLFAAPLILLAVLLATCAQGAELRLLGWNVESGSPRAEDPAEGSDPATIAAQLREFRDFDIVGLSEARPAAIKQFVDALSVGSGDTFLSIHTATGMDDRLVLAWRAKRLQLLEGYELHRFGDFPLNSLDEQGNWRHRSPLVGHFKDRQSGIEFLCMVNHLARGDEQVRIRQAIGLRNWAAAQKLPVAALGDFNFDYDFKTGRGNQAFDRFTEGDVWKWVRPEKLIDSNWADKDPRLPPGQRQDEYPDSLLDFVFEAGPAKAWLAKCQILTREGDFPDTGETSDHRPVAASVALP